MSNDTSIETHDGGYIDHGTRNEGGQIIDSFEFTEDGGDTITAGEGDGPEDHSPDGGNSNDASDIREPHRFGPRDYGERDSDYYVVGRYEQRRGEETGTLTLTKGWNSITVFAHSGQAIPAGYNRIPSGIYDILEGKDDDQYRLERRDSDYGNDEADTAWSPLERWPFDITHIRLHRPGRSKGCLTIGLFENDKSKSAWADWHEVKSMLDRSFLRQERVQKMIAVPRLGISGWTLGGIRGLEDIGVLGRLEVVDASKP